MEIRFWLSHLNFCLDTANMHLYRYITCIVQHASTYKTKANAGELEIPWGIPLVRWLCHPECSISLSKGERFMQI